MRIEDIKQKNICYNERKISADIEKNTAYFDKKLAVDKNFDIISRPLVIAERMCRMYFIDGMCKDELMQKILEYLSNLGVEDFPNKACMLARQYLPTIEMEAQNDWAEIEKNLLSGVLCLFIDGYDSCILIDARTYPARSVEEPQKDKALRGAKDGFVETIVFNTALIRRRIRNTDLRMEMQTIGKSSKTDVVVCYLDTRVNKDLLRRMKDILERIRVDALTMGQESLAENIYHSNKLNPFPKFKYTERPDTAAAQVLEGSIVLLVDNSPYAMILPTNAFTVLEESDDYYFPPITGTYLRLSRALIIVLSYFLTPTFLLLMRHSEWIPQSFTFINIKEEIHVPLLAQFLLLEIAIDGLKLAAVNTPNMLSTPFSVLAALVFGEFSVNSGWFNSEVMLYMVFVAIANYTQQSYEFAYAIKFFRMLTLILTSVFDVYGFIAGITILLLAMVNTQTIEGKGYFYPLLPLNVKKLYHKLVRR